jgi:hypothetical protein
MPRVWSSALYSQSNQHHHRHFPPGGLITQGFLLLKPQNTAGLSSVGISPIYFSSPFCLI